jgi:hypothetical protein
MGVPRDWGTTEAERAVAYPCDRFAPQAAETWFRAVPVDAARPVVFRWLCQLKVAPYSYDLLDNFGRTSPRTLTPGADNLAAGQRVMTIFELVDFSPQEHLTIRMSSPAALKVFGAFVLTYAVTDRAEGGCRLVAKMLVGDHARTGPLDAARRRALAWGDLFMMRRQLKTLATLAERS